MARRSRTSGWVTPFLAICSSERIVSRLLIRGYAGGVREERKLRLRLVVIVRFQWRFESSPRHSQYGPR